MEVRFPWGERELAFGLPASFVVHTIAIPKVFPPLQNLQEEIQKLLIRPQGSPPFADLVRKAERVLIVVDDIGRPTPAHLLIGSLLDEIETLGKRRILLLFATGLHRTMTEREMTKKIGRDNFARVRAANHNAFDTKHLVYLGRTSRGTPVHFNRSVVAADLRILIGTVEPHVQAGFGGGYKNLLPGCAGSETIGYNHYLGASPSLFSMVGYDPKKNPMRQDIEEACKKLPGKSFLLNSILNHKLEVVGIVGGDPIVAHRKAISFVEAMYGSPLEEQADLVLVNSYPLDVNFRQTVKGIANTLFAAKEGGVLVSFQYCRLGLDDARINKKALFFANLLKGMIHRFSPNQIHKLCSLLLKQLPPEERFFAYFAAQAVRRNTLLIFSETLKKELKTFPLPVYNDFNLLFRKIHRKLKGKRKLSVAVFPYGGVSYPILRKQGDMVC